ncbi:acyl-CoA thioesterase [Pseudonocardia sp. GCM10023141]|uniref:acyl-CoA thioesterase n=1 Tax=Pseudonocardia sp. GCM10023141 TaxID=3252653 RepID=UPI00360B5CB6
MDGQFAVRIVVRSYEVDANQHVNHAIYHRYGEHARTEHLAAAGCSMARLVERGMGIVLLETHVRFLRELRHGDDVEIDSRIAFGAGKTFEMAHTLRRADGVVAAEISCRMGLLDAAARRLLAEPRERLSEIATDPGLIGAHAHPDFA